MQIRDFVAVVATRSARLDRDRRASGRCPHRASALGPPSGCPDACEPRVALAHRSSRSSRTRRCARRDGTVFPQRSLRRDSNAIWYCGLGGANPWQDALRLGKTQNFADRFKQPVPLRFFFTQTFLPGSRETVDPSSPFVLGDAPFGSDPPRLLHAMKRRIQGPLLDPQRVVGDLLNPRGDAVTMLGLTA